MPVSAATVRATSFSGEFDSLGDEVIASAVAEVEGQYRTLKQELLVAQADVNHLIALHAAHILHLCLKQEAGGDDLPGPIKSESLARVGSRTYGSASKLEGNSSISDWQDSPYGRRHYAIWSKLPPGLCVVQP